MRNLSITFFAFIYAYLLAPISALAAVPDALTQGGEQLGEVGTAIGMETSNDLATVIGRLINVVLGVLGIVFLVLVVYAGFLYLTDQGKGEKAKKAMQLLTTAVIGIVIIVAAYAISNYVIGAMVSVVTP